MGGGNTQSKKGRTESHTGSNYPTGGGGRRGQLRKNKVKVLNHDPIFWLLKMNKKECPHPNLAKMFKGNKRTVQ